MWSHNVTIRHADERDCEALFTISVSAHAQGYDRLIPKRSYARFKRRFASTSKNRSAFIRIARVRINSPKWVFFVAVVDDVIVGYHCARQSPRGYTLRGLFVDPMYQGKGIGKKLFTTMIDRLDEYLLDFKVLKNNKRAILLYQQFGFKQAQRLTPRFFGAAQITMVRSNRG